MKYSICNTQLLPKAADLKKKEFDEFRLNISAIVLLKLLSQNAMESFLTSSVQVGEKARRLWVRDWWRPEEKAADHKKSDGGGSKNQKQKFEH